MKTPLRFFMIALLALLGAMSNAWAQTAPTITTTLPATAKAYTVVPFAVNVAKNDATAENVKLVLKLNGDNAVTQVTQLELKTSEGAAIAFSGTEAVLGTYAFAATLSPEFTAKFNAVGNFAYTLELQNAADNTVLTSTSSATAVSFLEPTVNTTLDNVSMGTLKIRTNEDVLFSLFGNPNDRTGDMVNVKLTLSDPTQHDNFSLMYNTTGTDFESLTIGADGVLVFGPEGGFLFNEEFEQLLKINFTEAGTYTYKVEIVRVDGNTLAQVTETITVLEGATVASTLDGATIIRGRTVDFDVTVDAGSWPNDTKVLARVVLANPAQAANIQLSYEASAGNYQPLTFNTEGVAYYGDPVNGINLADGTLKLRAVVTGNGTYNYAIELVKKIDGQLAAKSEETVTVKFDNATISSNLNNRTGVKATVAEEFTVAVTAGDVDPTTKVLGKFTLANPAQAANIKIEIQDLTGTYMEIPIKADGTVTIGEDGEIALSQLGELDFRVTFNTAGTYAYKLELIRVADDVVLASSNESVTVTAFQNATIATTLDARANVKATRAEEFTITATAGDVNPATMVLGRLTLTTAAQADDITLEYFDNTDNTYKPVAIGTDGVITIGPTGGMALSQINGLKFRATFDEAGTYGYKVELVRVSDNVVLATSNESVVVAAFQNATLASNYTNADNILAGETTNFTLTTTKGDLTDKTARFKFILADASKANNVIIENTDATEPVRLVFGTDGIAYYMPTAGPVTVSDAAYNFTAMFSASGDYNYTVQLVDATNSAVVLASTNVSAVAKTTTGIKKGFEKGGFAVYPTLTTGAVKVDLINARNANIQVIDMMGRAVVAKNNVNGVVELDLSKVAKGTYIVRIQDGSNVNTQRVVVR
ncbi:T9SS type A sorting domain-containing protein [Pontibacter cellulosilyticus]|uniref:T9SS type A sorting domain-containing protein n=1 Tax=Pontibacter cellulosilyticus TaxID=1720253 RepID=A0A923SN33_9BACT|nr:T9SS type A sorting domain-containing protein [Pontibacter cellulosilyticus]MBC5992785.1 T9SS type A sorting domain-containing protein [Pontibacter cellulosilyticus]